KERMVRLYEIPVRTETEGYIKRKKKKVPAILEAEVKLGPDRIEAVTEPGEDKNKEKDKDKIEEVKEVKEAGEDWLRF
ncbi:MAG: hypothetical protein ACOC1Q_00805, partial [Desulfosalsimonas sp.]